MKNMTCPTLQSSKARQVFLLREKKMKKILTYIILLYTTLSYAQLQNGFYRVHNYETERYVYVYDNTGKIYQKA